MLVRNIAGLNYKVGLLEGQQANPFSFGTSQGQIATPVNVQVDQVPTPGYQSAVQILTGSVAGSEPISAIPPAPQGITTNAAVVTSDQGSSLGNLLLAGAAVAGTIYLLSEGKGKKSKHTVTGTRKNKYTVPLLIGGSLVALYLYTQSNQAAAIPPVASNPATSLPAAATNIYQKTAQFVQTL